MPSLKYNEREIAVRVICPQCWKDADSVSLEYDAMMRCHRIEASCHGKTYNAGAVTDTELQGIYHACALEIIRYIPAAGLYEVASPFIAGRKLGKAWKP